MLLHTKSKEDFKDSILKYAETVAWGVFLLGFLFIEFR